MDKVLTEDKGQYQPWSHEEFMADRRVRRMPPTALKTYMMLLHEAFVCETRPHLPDDEEELELMAYCTDHEEWLSVRDTVLGMFEKGVVDGRPVLMKTRLIKDWSRLQGIREARSEAGRKGGLAKASKCLAKSSKEVKEVSNERNESEETQESIDHAEEYVKAERQIDLTCEQFFGKRANLRGRNLEELRKLVYVHKSSAVERAFGEWANENSDDPDIKDPVAKFLQVADDLLSTDTPAQVAAKDPEAVKVTREITYLSGGEVSFSDKHRVRISELLREYSFEEIVGAWKDWVQNQDSEPKFLAGKFVQAVDDVCYAARRKAQERAAEALVREETARRLQEAAEAERRAQDAAAVEEYDPLSAL